MLDARRIGFDGLSPFFEGLLRQTLPDAEFVGVEDMMRELRRAQAARGDRVPAHRGRRRGVGAVRRRNSRCVPGVTEHHLRAAFLDRMCALGTSQFAQQGTFTVIDPGAPLRWTTSDRVLAEGDVVALAGGVLWAGYEGSLARTWWCGNEAGPSKAARAGFTRWRAVMDRGDRAVPYRRTRCLTCVPRTKPPANPSRRCRLPTRSVSATKARWQVPA